MTPEDRQILVGKKTRGSTDDATEQLARISCARGVMIACAKSGALGYTLTLIGECCERVYEDEEVTVFKTHSEQHRLGPQQSGRPNPKSESADQKNYYSRNARISFPLTL